MYLDDALDIMSTVVEIILVILLVYQGAGLVLEHAWRIGACRQACAPRDYDLQEGNCYCLDGPNLIRKPTVTDK